MTMRRSDVLREQRGDDLRDTALREGARRRRRRARRRTWVARPATLVAVVCLLVLVLWMGLRVNQARAAYAGVTEEVATLQALADDDLVALSSRDLAPIIFSLDELGRDVSRLQRAVTLPPGVHQIAEHLPWIGARYRAGHDMLKVAALLSEAGETTAQVGREMLVAMEATGVSADGSRPSGTWLDILGRHQAELERVAAQVDEAQRIRAQLDEEALPAPARKRLPALDRALARVGDFGDLMGPDLPALQAALGGNGPVRYLVLFQNPAELRPSGGFPGTMGLVTLERGQLRDYQIFSSHELTQDYMRQRQERRPQPWPIEQYFPQDGFLLHDATWWADFPRGAAVTMEMYAETDWPPIDGIIALQPAVVSDLLRITGPITLSVDGEDREITADNVYAEIERQRRMRRAGNLDATHHKELIALIGETLIERMKTGDRQMLARMAASLLPAAEHRDLQFYASDPAVQAMADRQGWTGRLIPEEGVPTLAVNFANMAINKASLAMQPRLTLTLEGPENGQRRATLDVELEHLGSDDEDPLYGGFQRWWTEVLLPEGSAWIASDPSALPDPEALNGGSYQIDLFPGQTGRVHVEFTMPDAPSLLLRRQPGVRTAEVTVVDARCQQSREVSLTNDVKVDLASLCR